MSKRQRSFSLKWSATRVWPTNNFTNAMELKETKRDKLDSFEEWLDAELALQKRMFRSMGCDEEKATKAIDALREAYQSSQSFKP